MPPHLRCKKEDGIAAAGVALRAIRNSTDAFPPLKSVVATVIIVWDMSKKVKSNKRDCKRLAGRAAKIIHDIWRQTKDYEDHLPEEVQHSIGQIEQIFHDVVDFMRQLESQGFLRRYARQDVNKLRIEQFNKLLDEAIPAFGLNLQMSVHRLHTETSQNIRANQIASRVWRDEVLDVARMSELERTQLLTEILAKSPPTFFVLNRGTLFFFVNSKQLLFLLNSGKIVDTTLPLDSHDMIDS